MTLAAPAEILTGQIITATGTSGAFSASGAFLDLEVEVTAVSGTTPSATFSIQWSEDGVNFAPQAAGGSFAAITAVGNAILQFASLAPFYRLAWTVTGTTPSFTVNAFAWDQQ